MKKTFRRNQKKNQEDIYFIFYIYIHLYIYKYIYISKKYTNKRSEATVVNTPSFSPRVRTERGGEFTVGSEVVEAHELLRALLVVQ